jgi:colicin import membrane protein
MENLATPPVPPIFANERETNRFIRVSAIVHAILLAAFVGYNYIAPPTLSTFTPTLRVDLVGLPDALKNDVKLPSEQVVAPPPAPIKEKTPEAPKEKLKSDEMAMKPKAAERAEAMKNSLKRMKALAKISEDAAQPIKGNKVSPGSSLDSNAKEGEATYYDRLRSRLQENWELPGWLVRQNLSAKVQVQIDAVGRLAGYQFTQRSGNAQFDDAVVRTLKASVPFPRPPTLRVSVLVGFPL